jgi:hypothetical protein
MALPKPENDFDPTRQQLEDLQALLDRMLQIPVIQPGNVPDNVLPAARTKAPSLLVPSGSHQVDPKPIVPVTPVPSAVAPSAPQTSAEVMFSAPARPQPIAAKPKSLQSIVVTAAPPLPTQLPPIVQSESPPIEWAPIALPRRPSQPAARPPVHVGPRPSLALAPLRAVNWCFDGAVSPLGPVGRWLRSRTGRNVLGWLGVLLVLLAAGWGTTEATMRWISP